MIAGLIKHGALKGEHLNSAMMEIILGVAAIAGDVADIATDIKTCSEVIGNDDYKDYHVTYKVLTALGIIMGIIGVTSRILVSRRGYKERVLLAPLSSGDFVENELFKMRQRLKEIGRDMQNSMILIAVLVIEDIPMVTLNLIVLNSSIESIKGELMMTWNIWILLSIAFSMILGGLKMSHMKKVKDMVSERNQIKASIKAVTFIRRQSRLANSIPGGLQDGEAFVEVHTVRDVNSDESLTPSPPSGPQHTMNKNDGHGTPCI